MPVASRLTFGSNSLRADCRRACFVSRQSVSRVFEAGAPRQHRSSDSTWQWAPFLSVASSSMRKQSLLGLLIGLLIVLLVVLLSPPSFFPRPFPFVELPLEVQTAQRENVGSFESRWHRTKVSVIRSATMFQPARDLDQVACGEIFSATRLADVKQKSRQAFREVMQLTRIDALRRSIRLLRRTILTMHFDLRQFFHRLQLQNWKRLDLHEAFRFGTRATRIQS